MSAQRLTEVHAGSTAGATGRSGGAKRAHPPNTSATFFLKAWVFLACGVLVVGCSGDTVVDEPPELKDQIASVVVTASKTRLVGVGATVQLRAEARPPTGRAVPGTAFSWASSNPDVATVDALGLITTTPG